MNPKPNDLSEEVEPHPESLFKEKINQQITNFQIQISDEEAPVPEQNLKISQTHQKIEETIKGTNPSSSLKSKDTNSINTNFPNVPKRYTSSFNKTKFENYDVQQLKYFISKEYSSLKIEKEANFLERMKFDVCKRQNKEEKVNILLEQKKLKKEEKERVKAFNRLIEDANRRIEAHENLKIMKSKLEKDIIPAPSKKYKESEWNEIYRQRFKNYQENVDKRNENKIKGKQEQERLKEEMEVELCKVKKATKEEIEKSSKRLYEESIKRKLKMEQKLIGRVNYENSPSKYKKIINSEAYNFMSDEENDSNGYQKTNERNLAKNLKSNNGKVLLKNKQYKKTKNITENEYNNKRFEMLNKQNLNAPSSNNSNNKNKKKIVYQQKENKSNMEPYYEEEEEEREIPKPVKAETNYQLNDNKEENLKFAAIRRLNSTEMKLRENNFSHQDNVFANNKNNSSKKIVDHFFIKGFKP